MSNAVELDDAAAADEDRFEKRWKKGTDNRRSLLLACRMIRLSLPSSERDLAALHHEKDDGCFQCWKREGCWFVEWLLRGWSKSLDGYDHAENAECRKMGEAYGSEMEIDRDYGLQEQRRDDSHIEGWHRSSIAAERTFRSDRKQERRSGVVESKVSREEQKEEGNDRLDNEDNDEIGRKGIVEESTRSDADDVEEDDGTEEGYAGTE